MPRKPNIQRNQSPRERSELFVRRRNRQELLNWKEVSDLTLRTALATCGQAGATLSFAPALGGIGVTVRVYHGDHADNEYAGNGEELNELLELIIEGFGSKSEDPYEAWRKPGEGVAGPN